MPGTAGGGMRTLKSTFGVMGAFLPMLYCGGLLYYFLDISGSVKEATDSGLGPTLLGLGIAGLLFFIPLILKVVRLFARPRPPGSGNGPDVPAHDDEGGFDADAAIARYMAQRPVEAASNAPAPAPKGGMAGRPGFGRRNSGN